MKICVQGQIIDTELIYRISDVQLEDSECGYFGITAMAGAFTICFFCEKEIYIKLLASKFFKNDELKNEPSEFWKNHKTLWEEKVKVFREELERVKLEVYNYWSHGQSKLPQINFNL